MSEEYEGLTLHQRLARVREECTYVQARAMRQGKGAFHADVIRKVRASLNKWGLSWYQESGEQLNHQRVETVKDDRVQVTHESEYRFTFVMTCVDGYKKVISEKTQSGGKSTMTFPDTLRLTMDTLGIDFSDKGPGKASTYADKTLLIRLLNLEIGEDPDMDDLDLDPKIEPTRAKLIDEIRDLAAQICPEDPDSIINDGLAKLGEKYGRKAATILGVSVELLPKWRDRLKERLNDE